MHLRLAVAATVTVALLGAGRARAQNTTTPTPGTPTTAAFTKDDFLIRVQKKDSKGKWVFIPDIEAKYFFNNARCQCKTPVRVTVDFTTAGFQKRGLIGQPNQPPATGIVQLLIGPSGCLDATKSVRDTSHCLNPMGENTGTMFSNLGLGGGSPAWFADITVDDLFTVTGTAEAGSCDAERTQKIWLWLPSASGDAPFLQGDAAPELNVDVNGAPPTVPIGVTATPGNEAINISWTRIAGIPDLNGFVIFCSRDDLPVFKDSFYTGHEFHTAQTECKAPIPDTWGTSVLGTGTNTGSQAATPDGGVAADASVPPDAGVIAGRPINAPPPIHNLDSMYACSPLLPKTATSHRLRTLQNDIPYVVGVSAIDSAGNASLIETAYVQAPVYTRDFYRAYRDDGGEAVGGFCAYGQRGRAAGWMLAGAAALALAWRRRRS